jgi:hypothetical protein
MVQQRGSIDLQFGGKRFKYWPQDWPCWLKFMVVILSSYRQILRWFLRLGHEWFRPQCFPIRYSFVILSFDTSIPTSLSHLFKWNCVTAVYFDHRHVDLWQFWIKLASDRDTIAHPVTKVKSFISFLWAFL